MRRASVGGLGAAAMLFIAAVMAQHDRSAVGFARAGTEGFTVTNAGDAGPGSLREAILAADRLSSRAHIVVKAKRVSIDSPLPALVNPRGILLEAEPDAGMIDASRVPKGAVLQINSAGAALRGLHIVNAHDFGIVVNGPNVEIDGVTISDSKIGIVVGIAGKGLTVRTAVFERNDTGISAEPAVQGVSIASSIFRNNSRAGFWLVGAIEKPPARPATADAALVPSVRIIDCVFEQNAAGAVLANRPVMIHKSRFIGNRQSAILVLGTGAQLEDNEIRNTAGTAISIVMGNGVVVARNSLIDNTSTAIMARDSRVKIDHNTLQGNGFGIVSIAGQDSQPSLIQDNIVTKTTGDAITVIGGSPRVERNQVTHNRGAGLRVLDLQAGGGGSRAAPLLEANVITGNGVDLPATGVYKLAAVSPP